MSTYIIPKIVFIDDGINPEFIPQGIAFESYIADANGVHAGTAISDVSHGTMCFQIFNNHVCTPYSLVSIKVLDNQTGTGNHKALLAALKWCEGQNISIINMSMGTRQYTDFAAIATAISNLQNSIIVAACSNENTLTFPACLPQVIGVRHTSNELLAGRFVYLDKQYDQINVATCVKDEPIDFGSGYFEKMSGANSFATPIITARICNYLGQGFTTLEDVKKQLELDSVKDVIFTTYKFHKSHIREWENCSVPVVAVLDSAHEANHKLEILLDAFIQDGYRAIALSDAQHTNAAKFVYNLSWPGTGEATAVELIELYYNFALPDILFLQIDIQATTNMPKNLQADVLLKLPGVQMDGYVNIDEKYVLDMGKPVASLFADIIRLLS